MLNNTSFFYYLDAENCYLKVMVIMRLLIIIAIEATHHSIITPLLNNVDNKYCGMNKWEMVIIRDKRFVSALHTSWNVYLFSKNSVDFTQPAET